MFFMLPAHVTVLQGSPRPSLVPSVCSPAHLTKISTRFCNYISWQLNQVSRCAITTYRRPKPPMKVLFLDVDGVLTVPDGSGRLDDAKLKRLQSVVLQTQSVICISSNCESPTRLIVPLMRTSTELLLAPLSPGRLFPQLKHRLTMALQQYGGMRVIGATPDHGERSHGGAVRAPSPAKAALPSALLPPSPPAPHGLMNARAQPPPPPDVAGPT